MYLVIYFCSKKLVFYSKRKTKHCKTICACPEAEPRFSGDISIVGVGYIVDN